MGVQSIGKFLLTFLPGCSACTSRKGSCLHCHRGVHLMRNSWLNSIKDPTHASHSLLLHIVHIACTALQPLNAQSRRVRNVFGAAGSPRRQHCTLGRAVGRLGIAGVHSGRHPRGSAVLVGHPVRHAEPTRRSQHREGGQAGVKKGHQC